MPAYITGFGVKKLIFYERNKF
uniref:Uncharacterized protein n=1 Tax=Anguilla anguilla TaxID=7936 RepID=A0A0E9SRR2_ANGAN